MCVASIFYVEELFDAVVLPQLGHEPVEMNLMASSFPVVDDNSFLLDENIPVPLPILLSVFPPKMYILNVFAFYEPIFLIELIFTLYKYM